MLNIYFGSLKNEIKYAEPYFDAYMEPDWLDDDLNKKMILDIDRSKVIARNIIESPILGTIPPQWLSGGVKALICMNSDDRGYVFNGTNCGDNCAKWILKIAEKKDLTITLHHFLDFSRDFGKNSNEFRIKLLNSGKIITSFREYAIEFTDWQVMVRNGVIDSFGNKLR